MWKSVGQLQPGPRKKSWHSAMDISGDDPEVLRYDKADLFTAVNELGAVKDEYDVAIDAFRSRFKRGDAWREAMKAIRK